MILTYRNKAIRSISEPVVFPDPDLESLIKTLWEELAKSGNGIGVAANQIGVLKQVGVIKFPKHKIKVPMTITTAISGGTITHTPSSGMKVIVHKGRSVGMTETNLDMRRFVKPDREIELEAQELVLINPEILKKEEDGLVSEGCLSVPNIYQEIIRPRKVYIKNHSTDGKENFIEAEHLLAQCICHEIDHMNGIVFIDHFTKSQKIIMENRLKRIK